MMETIAEIVTGSAHIIIYRDTEGRIVLGGHGWIEYYEAEGA